MEPIEFSSIFNRLTMIGRYAIETDAESFLEAIEHTQGVAHILGPSVYVRGLARLEAMREYARAAAAFRAAALKFREATLDPEAPAELTAGGGA